MSKAGHSFSRDADHCRVCGVYHEDAATACVTPDDQVWVRERAAEILNRRARLRVRAAALAKDLGVLCCDSDECNKRADVIERIVTDFMELR